MRYMVGVDVGGTFTDLTLVDVAAGIVRVHKVRSTPDDPSLAIMTGISQLLEQNGVAFEAVDYLAHGTTVATNALIERKGAPTGLLTTKGFGDLLEIGRQIRPSLYDLFMEKPAPIVPSHLRVEVPERLYYDGSVRTPLDERALQEGIDYLRAAGVQAVAICFLFSYVNSAHERIAADAVRQRFPEAYVSISHEVVPEFREYARLSTTVLNAYLGPVMRGYIENFQRFVRATGIPANPYITQSNGGIISIDQGIDYPIRTAVSGPSAGVIAATYLGKITGLRELITFDMGGTSADISLIENATPRMSLDREVQGLPARVPMLDITTIGAGGGSIAWVDAGGALKVGPESAGAAPGPACYGFGGREPTVTDANVLLGRMNPTGILGGRMALDLSAARRAIEQRICQPTGLSPLEAATGILAVVNANMVRAIRLVSVERGHDPRTFALVAFGGAGPLHAAAVARELGIPTVVVPLSPGTLCSMGLLVADIRSDYVRTHPLLPEPDSVDELRTLFDSMRVAATALLDAERIPLNQRQFELRIDARYRGQNYELSVSVRDAELTAAGLATIVDRFHAEHQRTYGHANTSAAVEFVNYRLAAMGQLPKAPVRQAEERRGGAPRPVDSRRVSFAEGTGPGFVDTPIYQRTDLRPGDRLVGPAVIEQMDATTVLAPDQSAVVDPYLNMLITASAEGA